MKTAFSTILLITLLSGLSIAQPNPDTLWTRTYGGEGYNYAYSIKQTFDGGFIITGHTTSFGAGGSDIYLIKTRSNGDTLWTKTFGGSSDEHAYSVLVTNDGGYIVTGTTESFGAGEYDVYLLKINSNGDTLWTRTYGGSFGDRAYSVEQTNDGGYILGGWTSSFGIGYHSNLYLIRTNSFGDTLWTKTYGGNQSDYGRCALQTSDGGFVIAGYSFSFSAGETDAYLVKTDSIGDTLWTRTFGVSGTADHAYSVMQTNDGGYILAGLTSSFGAGYDDIYVVRTDSVGDSLWTRTYGGADFECGYSIKQTISGHYIIAGWSSSFGAGSGDFYLIKINDIGDLIWSETYGGSGGEIAYSVQQTSDGGYVAAGFSNSFPTGQNKFYIVRTLSERMLQVLSPNGDEEWSVFHMDTVRWSTVEYNGGIRIELNRDYPEGIWEVLVDSTGNDGQEEIYVTDPLSDSCRVRISALEDTTSDISDDDFSINSSLGYLALAKSNVLNTPIISWNYGSVECALDTSEVFFLKNFGNESIVVFDPESPAGPYFSSLSSCSSFFALAPEEVSECSLTITYNPSGTGIDYDTLRIMTDAVNAQGGYVRIPLTGQQISTPAVPQVTISIEGDDARLTWEPITESILGCSVDVTAYLVFYSPTIDGPYYFHGLTADTTYVHNWVVPFASGMFYEVLAYTGELDLQDLILNSGRTLTREEVTALLNREKHHRTNR